MTNNADSIHIAVDTPILNTREGIFETSFYGYPIELTLPGLCMNVRCIRRYSDFESLRNQLCAEHWDCIVAPIPEKETLQDKLSTRDSDHSIMLEYRRIALRRFLLRVAYHSILGKSPLLAKFTNDEEWRQCLKNPICMRTFLSVNIAEDFMKSIRNPSAKSDGSEYIKLLGPSVDAGLDMATIDGINRYTSQLENGLRNLRDRFQALANRRRASGVALLEFATEFGMLADGEADIRLRESILALQEHGTQVSMVYREQADSDMHQIVSTLCYYVGMCAAVRQTLSNISSAMNELHALNLRIQNAEEKLSYANGPDEQLAQNALTSLSAEKLHLEREVNQAERTFKQEFSRFHREKQYDMVELLKVFGELELAYSSNLKNKWEGLRPLIEDLAS